MPADVHAPASSNAPSEHYRQHRVVEAPAVDAHEFRPGWRVKSKLWLLLECERIDRRQLEAALAFRDWCEAVGRQRGSAWLAARVDGGLRPGGGLITEHQLDAARRLRDAAAALGDGRMNILRLTVVDDLAWAQLGRRLGLAISTAKARVIEAIAALALWRADQPIPSPPRSKLRIEPGRW